MTLKVTGLILLDVHPTQTRVAQFLPGRCHDALNRLLLLMPWSTRSLMSLSMQWVKCLGQRGYLVIDDVAVEKAYARRLAWAGWTYSFAKKRSEFIVFDTHYTAGWFTKRLAGLGLCWQGTLDSKTLIVWQGRKQAVRDLPPRLKLKWRKHLGVRATALTVYAPKYGSLRLVVVRNRHGKGRTWSPTS
jgi:hypothetical protein